jgi:hypothetical protein
MTAERKDRTIINCAAIGSGQDAALLRTYRVNTP